MGAENRNSAPAEVGLQLADLDHSSLGGYSEGEWPARECYLTRHGLPPLCNLLHYSCHIVLHCCNSLHIHFCSVIVMMMLLELDASSLACQPRSRFARRAAGTSTMRCPTTRSFAIARGDSATAWTYAARVDTLSHRVAVTHPARCIPSRTTRSSQLHRSGCLHELEVMHAARWSESQECR